MPVSSSLLPVSEGRCGGLIKIVRENLNGFSAHTFSLQRLFL